MIEEFIIKRFGDLIHVIWVIPILSLIHELEEWNIMKWYKKHYKNLPNSTNLSVRIWIILLSAVIFLLTLVAYSFNESFLFSLIIIFLSVFITSNTAQHIIWTIQYKSYSIGLVTSLLSFAGVIYVNIILLKNSLLMTPFYLLFILTISTIIKTIKSKNEMTSEIRKIHEMSIWITKKFFNNKLK